MSYQHPPVSRRRYSSVEETRQTALETIKTTWNDIDHLLQPLSEVVVSLNALSSPSLEPIAPIVRLLQNDDTTNKLNAFFEKVISSLAAAVARIQLRNTDDADDVSMQEDAVDASSETGHSSSQVILLEDEVLEYLISANVLLKTLGYATHPHCPAAAALILRWNLLRILETLVSSCLKDPRLLSHESILIPLLALFDACTGSRHPATDQKMMAVMNELIYCLKQEPELVQFFIEEETHTVDVQSSADDGIRDLRLLSYLFPHVHNPLETGRLARSAVLALLPILQRNEQLSAHVAGKSSFSAVLISGLCAFYHSLPGKLFAMFGPGWHKISPYDLTCSVDLEYFTEYMVFCNAAVQLSHPLVQSSIISFFKKLFLTPVVGPALGQEASEDLIQSVAYLEFFIRMLHERALRTAVLDHLITAKINDRAIIDHLTECILNANSRVATMSIVLFDTLLSLNYKPLLEHLFMRYLKAARPFLQSDVFQSGDSLNNVILAETLLEFIPQCCQQLGIVTEPPAAQESQSSPGMLKKLFGRSEKISTADLPPVELPPYSDYLLYARYNLHCIWREFSDLTDVDGSVSRDDAAIQETIGLFPDLELHGVGIGGPFLASIFYKLDHLVEHDLYFSLQLTGLIARIMMFPYKEVWAFVFGQNYTPELAGRSLIQVLGTLKLYVDSVIPSNSLGKALLERVYRSLIPRRAGSPSSQTPVVSTPQPERKSLSFLRSGPKVSETDYVDSIFLDADTIMESVEMDGHGPRYSRRNSAAGGPDQLKIRMAAYTAVLLNEFLQELAAICHEKAILTAMISCDLFDGA
ncbi:FHF complex subunit HOOK interacting protein 1B-like [Paramacrobiotus metropolitanus]|uniref:FHF complex subunit HOOK interacting protein 1B-like n=1 Tax=Paramacrobiotus metropolitanus TaxID=2943436 RepID=UPI0024455FDA|nr:FHF complex subunit HOOK interacting protein 1B-like [Paramacrobiotus metropolitanus]